MIRFLCLCACLVLQAGCGRSNNLLLGRVEAMVGGRAVVVTDCYRVRVDPPETLAGGEYHFMPCRDADIRIRGDELSVNGQSYGRIGAHDRVLVDHGVVSVTR
jgi:hypothetical protein